MSPNAYYAFLFASLAWSTSQGIYESLRSLLGRVFLQRIASNQRARPSNQKRSRDKPFPNHRIEANPATLGTQKDLVTKARSTPHTMSTTTPRIPPIYRAIFIALDIILPLTGILLNTFSPLTALQNYTPTPSPAINPETYVLLDCTSGFFAALCFINVYLLVYRPHDVVVWRGVVGGVLLQDLFMVGGFLREMRLRQAMGVTVWTGADWGNVGGYTAIAIVRGLFVMGVGMGGTGPGVAEMKKEL